MQLSLGCVGLLIAAAASADYTNVPDVPGQPPRNAIVEYAAPGGVPYYNETPPPPECNSNQYGFASEDEAIAFVLDCTMTPGDLHWPLFDQHFDRVVLTGKDPWRLHGPFGEARTIYLRIDVTQTFTDGRVYNSSIYTNWEIWKVYKCADCFGFKGGPLTAPGQQVLCNPLWFCLDKNSCQKPGAGSGGFGGGAGGGAQQNSPLVGNPINLGNGYKLQVETDYVGSGVFPLRFARTYFSSGHNTWIASTALGTRWRHNYDHWLRFYGAPTTGSVYVFRDDVLPAIFTLQSGVWVTDSDSKDRVTMLVDGNGNPTGWQYVSETDETETYDVSGRLISIKNRAGATQTLTYSNATTLPAVAPRPGLLIAVTDPVGRKLQFAYDSKARISTVTTPDAKTYTFAYDGVNNLLQATYPDGKSRQYQFENPSFPNALTGIVDENGSRFATYGYGTSGRAVSSQHAGGANAVTVTNITAGPSGGSATVTDALGTARTYTTVNVLGAAKLAGVSQPCPSCGGSAAQALTYDANGNLASTIDFNNKKVCYAYNVSRNLETGRVEGLLSVENCASSLASPPSRPDVRKMTTTWHPTYRLPATFTEPAAGGTRTTTFTYDASGNLTQKSITAPKNDGTSATITRSWTWSHGTLGRVAKVTDPNGKVTHYTYYADADPALGKRGNVQSITNAAGHTTQITAYDVHGRALSITDPIGLVTTLMYDLRGRLTSRQVGVETTTYQYDGLGQLTKVTQPDNSYLQYTYDTAHRLTQINDGLGNRIVYTLDAMGNRRREDVYDPANTLARTRSRTYDALNRLASDLGAQSQSTTYGYDSNNNLLTVTDPLSHRTTNTYDALNRLTQVLDPGGGTTTYAYDPANNLIQVIDSRSVTTTYTYDGLGNLFAQLSGDTGTTASTFDAAGNTATRTDARGATATYTYDALNRATQVVFSRAGTPNEMQSFVYDGGAGGAPNAKGRLTQITDAAAVTSWTYNSQGRVASKSTQVGAVTKTISYGYNAAGQLTTVTTPSGQQLGYTYLNNRVTALTANGQVLVGGAVAEPFGALGAWQWGYGFFTFRDYDQDGRLAGWEFRNGASLLRKNLSYDQASRIVGLADPNVPANNQTYQYDVLDRLSVAQTGTPATHTQQFSYDAVGNRLNAALDGTTTNSTYGASHNRLQILAGAVSPNYLNGASALAFTYNNANRLVAVQSSGVPLATYAVNALGQRVRKIAGGVTTLFVYDEQGHLLGEYDSAGNLIEETVWLEDLPVATLRPTGTGNPTPINVYYVHADHLGSPRAVTRPGDNAVMWRWDNVDPFGLNLPNENPGGAGTFKYALRFPGQYYDAETGTHYNYFRDYDPVIGRYLESDPIGLLGGVNTFAYVNSNPLKFFDSRGLAAQLCSRWFYPVPVPYARHCFVEYSGGGSSSYDDKGVHSDPAPGWWPGSCVATKGDPADDCVKSEMEKCKGSDYDFTSNNCCHCAERALKACGLSFPAKDWPNWPVNPGPPPGSRPPAR